jgi:hypothetical protein
VRLTVVVAAAAVAVAAIGAGVVLLAPWSSESGSGPGSRGVYVVSATTGDVVKVDPETREVSETIRLGAAYLSSIAIAGEYLYYSTFSPESSWSSIGRYNLSTGENEATFIDHEFHWAFLRASPTDPEVLFVGERGLSSASIQKWGVPASGEVPSLLTETEPAGPLGGDLQDFEISDDGATIWSAAANPQDFLELSTSDLRLTGRRFPVEYWPNSVDWVSVGGTEYLLGGTNSYSEPSIHLYRTNDPASAQHYGLTDAGTHIAGAVALAPDATKIYRMVGEEGADGSIETLSTDMGALLAAAPVRLSEYFYDSIQTDPATGIVFVSLEDGVGVLDPDGTLVETVPIPGPGQIVITS